MVPESSDSERAATFLSECERRLRYRFRNKQFLIEALTHASGAAHRLESNERLEFLGDAILGAIISDMLFRRFPAYREGDLTRLKSMLVSRQTCARVTEMLNLKSFLIAGKALTSCPGIPQSLLADMFESIVGAIYLDGGFDAAREFVARFLEPEIEAAVIDQISGNYKSELQVLAQRDFGVIPSYSLAEEFGPDHNKWFKVVARIGERSFAPAWGKTKKEAEQRAARNALLELAGYKEPDDEAPGPLAPPFDGPAPGTKR